MTTDTDATARRRRALADRLDALAVDAVVVDAAVNVRYLTGFTGSNAGVIVHRDGTARFATDGRYLTQAAAEVPDLPALDTRTPALTLVETAPPGLAVAVDEATVTVAAYRALEQAAGDGRRLVPVAAPVMPLRMVKDAGEIAALAAACAATDAAVEFVVAHTLRPGVTELELAWEIEAQMRHHGTPGVGFESIVGFGPHSAVPHHAPGDRPLGDGDLVVMDVGAIVDGYHADMTRTVVYGEPADWQRELHALVVDIQQQCLDLVRPGASTRDIQLHYVAAVRDAGHAVAHGLGHGVGLEIHEEPFMTSDGEPTELVEDMTITIEPGVYLPGRGGVRIEDTVVVRASGVGSLTRSSSDAVSV